MIDVKVFVAVPFITACILFILSIGFEFPVYIRFPFSETVEPMGAEEGVLLVIDGTG
jgi:hypothetical protein